jgi:hypothetical protein
MTADGLNNAWPVAAVAMDAVVRSCSHEEAGLSYRDGSLCVSNARADAKPDREQEHEDRLCDSSHQHAIHLDFDFEPKLLGIKASSITISATDI